MLSTLILQGYGKKEDWNCAEKILYGANQVYSLGLDKQALKMSAGFGGGMAIGSVCGALTAAVMVLGLLFVKNNAHESSRIKELTQELFITYKQEMADIHCDPLKAMYRTDEIQCTNVIAKAAEVLDRIIARESSIL
jgi:C_GCAxxG_C_C family probable redox protein